MTRNLPEISEFAATVARSFEATTSVLSERDVSLAIAGCHLLLIRDHGHAISLSLPTGEKAWSWRTREELAAQLPELQQQVTAYRASFPNAMSMADVIVALTPVLAPIGGPWRVKFPGTPVPSECWLESSDGRSVGLFQNQPSQFAQPSVRVVVWVGDQMKNHGASTPRSLSMLGPWIGPMLAEQAKAQAAAAVEDQREKALPVPSVEDVLARLRDGQRIQASGGRYHETFFMQGATLRCEVFDEGHTQVFDATVDELAGSIKAYPADFRPR